MLRNIVQFSTKLKGLSVVKVTCTNLHIHVENYSKFTGRKHAAIVNEDELFDEPEASYPMDRYSDSELSLRRRNRKPTRRQRSALRQLDVEEDAVIGNSKNTQRTAKVDDGPEKKKTVFTKLYDNEKILSPLMMQIKSKKQRKKLNKILLEGKRLITDALQAGLVPEKIIFSRNPDLEKLPLNRSQTEIYKVPYRTIQLWSSLSTPSGLMGVFETPDVEKFQVNDSLPITIVCDNIRDPGNMGSILRAAAGVGCDKVILTKGCVDIWESKVLRSAAGTHFRLPIYNDKNWHDIRLMLSPGAKYIVADNQVDSELLSNDNNNESENIKESQNFDTESIAKENADKIIEDEENDDDDDVNTKTDELTREAMSKELSIVPYYSLDYTQDETVIIVGGETEGLSYSSLKIASDNGGCRVNVPLNNGVESLNSGMALGIIAFEIKRQFLMAVNK
ncbi:rRNA methyltransferase 3, mitochondrial [Leptopilina heterotoma]|uniref:rRNA methyltransferase 3, mitochondrial n=1 Tax=Leptopilina heterotoma TaxID=63436 RepID=UPI001CA9995E|nr:rRNA methyltransferase 3, mitochondrial [Leptopilina heterotoma]